MITMCCCCLFSLHIIIIIIVIVKSQIRARGAKLDCDNRSGIQCEYSCKNIGRAVQKAWPNTLKKDQRNYDNVEDKQP